MQAQSKSKSNSVKRLSAEHYEELRQGSGLSDDTIKACGFYTETDPHAIGKMLNWSGPAPQLGECLIIPYTNGYCRLKPSNPRESGGKYETPWKGPILLYVPPKTDPVLTNPAVPLLITE